MKINIKDKMVKMGISRYELAQRIGITYPTIDNIYKGNSSSIKLEILESICKELDCSLDEILIFDDADMKERQLKRLTAYYEKLNKQNNKSDTQ